MSHNTTDTTRSVSDLLNDDGTVNENKIRSISNRGNANLEAVSPEACATWRRDAVGAPNVQTVAEEHDRAKDTVRRHLRGNCSCEHDTPALQYQREYQEGRTGAAGEWRAVE